MKKPTKLELRRTIETSMALLDGPERNSQFPVRELSGVATTHGPVFVGIDPALCWHLMMSVSGDEVVRQDHRSSGVHIQPRELVDGRQRRRFVELVCTKPRLNRLFVIIAADVLERLLEQPSAAQKVLSDTIEQWRELLRRAAQQVDEARLRGAFGELHQLRHLVALDVAAAAGWKGPDGAPHDIELGSLAIEVKSKGRSGSVVVISGLEQLDEPTGGELVLITQVVEWDDAGQSIGDVVRDIGEMGGDRGLLLDGLAKLGIDPDDEQCARLRMTVRDEKAYAVGPEFPRLIASDLSSGHLHPAIRKLTYSVDLSSSAVLTEQELQSFRERMVTR